MHKRDPIQGEHASWGASRLSAVPPYFDFGEGGRPEPKENTSSVGDFGGA